MGFLSTGEANLLPVDTMPSEEFSRGGGDPWSTVGLNGDSGSNLGADLRPALAIPSMGESTSADDPDGIVGTDGNVLGGSMSASPLDGLEGETSLAVMSSDS